MSGKSNGIKKLIDKFDFDSPVILTYAFICVAVFILNSISLNRLNNELFSTDPHAGFGIRTVFRSFLYIFGHSSLSHLTGNMTLFLLLGPIVEERFGSKKLIIMIATTAVITAIVNSLLFSEGIIGASGIVFMLIMLSAFREKSGNKIPITLVLVCIIYIGGEIASGIFASDNISHFGHIAGGVCGLGWGMFHKKL